MVRLLSQPSNGSDANLQAMTAPALDAEPACPGAAEALPDTTDRVLGTLRAERRPFADFSREDWDRIAVAGATIERASMLSSDR